MDSIGVRSADVWRSLVLVVGVVGTEEELVEVELTTVEYGRVR